MSWTEQGAILQLAKDVIKLVYPEAHCAPLAHAEYPHFYVIRARRSERSESLATGPTPEGAWRNACQSFKRIMDKASACKPTQPNKQED